MPPPSPVAMRLSRQFLALALSICVFLPTPALAASLVEAPVRTAPALPGVGVINLGTISVPANMPVPSATINTSLAADAGVELPSAQAPVAAAAPSVANHPIIDILNQMQAKGLAMPTTLSGREDAAQWLAAAQVLPEGSAKQTIVGMAASAAAGTPGVGLGPALDKTYNGSAQASGAALPAAATFWDRLAGSRLIPSGLRKRLPKRAEDKPKPQLMDVEGLAVPLDKARYTPNLSSLPASTREVAAGEKQIVGQDKALKSIRAGLEMTGPGYNLYISGPDGSGRETALKSILAEVAPKMPTSPDVVAVTNFADPEKPIFLNLEPGSAAEFAAAVKEFVRTYQMGFPQALNSDAAKGLKRQVNAKLNEAADERQAEFDEAVSQVRVDGKFGIKVSPKDAGDGEHFNFNVAVTYAVFPAGLKEKLAEIRAEAAAKVKVKGYGVSIDESDNIALTKEVDGKAVAMSPEEMAAEEQAGRLDEQVITELVQQATPFLTQIGALRRQTEMRTVSSEDEFKQLVNDGVINEAEWNAAIKKAGRVAEPFIEEFKSLVATNRAEKTVAYMQMHQQIAAMLVQQVGRKVLAAVMPNRHDTPEHKAWAKSAQQRMGALQAEIAKIKVHGYGILVNEESAATGNVGLSHEVDGEMVPMTPQEMQAKMASGDLGEDIIKDIVKAAQPVLKKMAALAAQIDQEHEALHKSDPPPTEDQKKAMGYAQALLKHAIADFGSFLPGADDGSIGRRDPLDHYRVSVLRANDGAKGARVIFEDKPTVERLLGYVEAEKDTRVINGVALRTLSPGGPTVHTGSLVQADAIVMDVMQLLRNPGAFHAVMEAQRTGLIEIPEEGSIFGLQMTGKYHVSHRPKIILIGSPYIKMLLQHYEEDFQRGFNASAEFAHELDINSESVSGYMQFMKKIVIKSAGSVLDFNRDAIGAVLEYASWEAESNEKFSAQFGAIYNLMREASRLAKNAGRKEVTREDVQGALDDRKDSTSQHQKRYMELLEKRVFVVDTEGMKYNQANGLVVMGNFGAPARVTFAESSSNKGGGVVSNDQSAHWTGSSMDKAFANVQGYYEATYGKAVENIIKRYSFEQTYGGLDGDSATGIKTALGELSMAGLPIRQDGAMTGSMDQLGNIQAIGGVNYKLEGLFDLLGHFGRLVPRENIRERAFAIIPRSNVSQLTLKPEIIQAIREKRFVIYAIENVRQAEEILSYAPYAEISRRVKAYGEHEELMAAAKMGLAKKYAEDPAKLRTALAELKKKDEAWKAEMKAEAEGYRAAALAPKS